MFYIRSIANFIFDRTMGAATSSIEPSHEQPDIWGDLPQPQPYTNPNVLVPSEVPENPIEEPETALETTVPGTASQTTAPEPSNSRGAVVDTGGTNESELERTVQHLARENMRLSVARMDLENSCEVYKGKYNEERRQALEFLGLLDKLGVEAEQNKQDLEEFRGQVHVEQEEKIRLMEELKELKLELLSEKEIATKQADVFRREQESHQEVIQELKEQLNSNQRTIEELQRKFHAEQMKSQQLSAENERLNADAGKKTTSAGECSSRDDERGDSSVAGDGEDLPRPDRAESPKVIAEMLKFREELSTKREARQRAISALSTEMERLRTELTAERTAREVTSEELALVKEQQGSSYNGDMIKDLQRQLKEEKELRRRTQIECEQLRKQVQNSELLLRKKDDEVDDIQKAVESDKQKSQKQVLALKEVISLSKQMLSIREDQISQLKIRFRRIEHTMKERNMGPITNQESIESSLREEYASQIDNIKSLKSLYEERMKLAEDEKKKYVQDTEEKSQQLEKEVKKCAELEAKLVEFESTMEEKEEVISNLETQVDRASDESRSLADELALINSLFTQMLFNNGATDMDLDKLTRFLQENHDLISEITIKEDGKETAPGLSKLLMDLVTQLNASESEYKIELEKNTTEEGTSETSQAVKPDEESTTMAAQDIASNLPKVWRVLMELLSHRVAPTPVEDNKNSCYKNVDTPSGPRSVISVSKTFIRLKDLIVEKKYLQKELTRLKQLNGHLECKLDEQESRLSQVSTELHKTWDVVGKMRTQHQQLHTHEKILRYELQQKRKMLTELKQELEYCREKWERARQKNSDTEVEWKKLRKEFASRKKQPNDTFNNSGESGFSDGKESEDEDSAAKGKDHSTSPIPTDVEECTSPAEEPEARNTSCRLHEVSSPEYSESVSTENHSPDFNPGSPEPSSHFDASIEHPNDVGSTPDDGYPRTPHMDDQVQCSTVSLITMLKQQLAFFSRNLEMITSGAVDPTNQQTEAIQSIFSLPAIQLPESLSHLGAEEYSPVRSVSPRTMLYSNSNPVLNSLNARSKSLSPTSNSSLSISTVNAEFSRDQTIPGKRLEDTSQQSDEESPSTSSETKIEDSRLTIDTEPPENRHPTEEPKILRRSDMTPEQILDARAARLQRLEEQCQQLFNKVTKTTDRRVALTNRLELLHDHYGTAEVPSENAPGSSSTITIPPPPPLPPNTIPPVRIPTSSTNLTQNRTEPTSGSSSTNQNDEPDNDEEDISRHPSGDTTPEINDD